MRATVAHPRTMMRHSFYEWRLRALRQACRMLDTRPIMIERADQIVVVRTDRLGDLVVTIPALEELRQKYPNKRLVLVAGAGNGDLAQLVKEWGTVDEVWLARDGVWGIRSPSSVPTVNALLRQLCIRPSVVYFLTPTLWPVLSCRGRGHQVRSRVTTGTAGDIHEASIVIRTLAVEGTGTCNARSMSQLALTETPLKPYCVVHLNAHPLRSWSQTAWIDLLRRIAETHLIYLVGDKSVTALADSLVNAVSTNLLNVAGQTSMGELVRLLRRAVLVIGTDSGVMHLAGYLGAKTFTLFGPSLPQQWRPLGPEVRVFYRHRWCSPCRLNDCPYEPGQRCLDDITVSSVWDGIVEALQ